MPLHVDRRNAADRRWIKVSTLFKAKPAFSIRHPIVSGSMARHVLVFGVVGTPNGGSVRANYDESHYVHFSMLERTAELLTFWSLYTGVNGRGAVEFAFEGVLENSRNAYDSSQGEKLQSISNAFAAFYDRVNVEDGLFGEALCDGAKMVQLLDGGDGGLNSDMLTEVMNRVTKDTFTGCKDCNALVTLGKFVGELFGIAFFSARIPGDADVRSKQKHVKTLQRALANGMGVEHMIHYILLSGAVYKGERVAHDGGTCMFRVDDPKRKVSWRARYLLNWCALQVLLCLWAYGAESPTIAHHRSYIYAGAADFYTSLMLFVLHAAVGHRGVVGADDSLMPFETFHYFYSSYMPFFMHGRSNNLAFTVLGLGDDSAFAQLFPAQALASSAEPLGAVRRQLAQIMNGVAAFWTEHFSSVSDFILRGGDSDAARFFVSRQMRGDLDRGASGLMNNLSMQSFSDLLCPVWYWYHFKHITMPRIGRLCKLYDDTLSPGNDAEALYMWRLWYNLFCGAVRMLQAADGLGLPAGLANGPGSLRAHLRDPSSIR